MATWEDHRNGTSPGMGQALVDICDSFAELDEEDFSTLELLAVDYLSDLSESSAADEPEDLLLKTQSGDIRCRLHHAEDGDAAVIWVFGAGGGLGGPAGGVYERLAAQLLPRAVTSLQLDYRHPGDLEECVLDVLLGTAFLNALDKTRLVVVGHSFGGAVAITTGAFTGDEVVGVIALSSQCYGTDSVAHLSPKPLLLIHGEADEVLSDACSHDIYRRAHEPKTLITYPNCRHGLDQCREELDRDLTAWLQRILHLPS